MTLRDLGERLFKPTSLQTHEFTGRSHRVDRSTWLWSPPVQRAVKGAAFVTPPVCWRAYRDQFPILSDSVYYDVAYKASVPNRVTEAVLGYFSDNQRMAGDRVALAAAIDDVRAKIAGLIGAGPSQVAFVKNASEGMNLLAHAISYRDGDNVVISDQEHPTNECPWLNLNRYGVEVRKVESREHRFGVEELAGLVDARTRVVSLSAVCQVSGFAPDLRAISAFCRRRGVLLYIDAIQALGARALRVDEISIDGLVTSGHKWLLGPYGTGFLYASSALIDRATAIFASKHYSRLDLENANTAYITDAGRWEYGSLNYPGLFGLGAGLDMILELGIPRIEARINDLVAELRASTERMGLDSVTPASGEGSATGIFSFAIANAARLAARLREQRIFVSERKGVLRTSQHFYNDETDIMRFVDALKASGSV